MQYCDDDTTLTVNIKRRVFEYLDEKHSNPLARRLLSVASFLGLRFIADHVPTDVGMSRVNSWVVEEGAAYVASKNEQAQP